MAINQEWRKQKRDYFFYWKGDGGIYKKQEASSSGEL